MEKKKCVVCEKVITKETAGVAYKLRATVNWKYIDHCYHIHHLWAACYCPMCDWYYGDRFADLEDHIEKEHSWEAFDKAIVLKVMGGESC